MRKAIAFFLLVSIVMLIIPTTAFVVTTDITDNKNTQPVSSNTNKNTSSVFSETTSSIASTTANTFNKSAGNVIYKMYDVNTKEVKSLKASEYIKGVVGAEMPLSYSTEALKAQAVAANTYALRIIAQNNADKSLNGAYFSNDPKKFQAYKSKEELKKTYGDKFDEYYKKLSDAVDEVIDKVIVYNNEPIVAVFHAVSTGVTENAENVWGNKVSYLKSVDSNADKTSPSYQTTTTLTPKEIKEKLKKHYPKISFSIFKNKWFIIKKSLPSGVITEIKVGNITLNGNELRNILGLKSACFTVCYKNGNFEFTTKGYGHGVGLSQYGANELAKQGKNYKQILKHYYTGVEIISS